MLSKRSLAQALSVLAFSMNLISRDYWGIFSSICVATLGLFFLVETLSVLKKIEPNEARHMTVITSVGLFFIVAILTKLVIPFIASNDFSGGLLIAVIYFSLFLAFLWLWNRTVWKKYKQVFKTRTDESRNKYNRVTNSIVLLVVLVGIDGADIMFLVNLLVSFLSEILKLLAMLLAELSKVITFLSKKLRNDGWKLHLRLLKKELKDLDDWLWSLPSYSGRFLKGVPLLLFAFVGCLPFIFYSYQVDFLHFNPTPLLGMAIFSIPGIIAVLAVRIPWRVGKGRGPSLRKRLFILSFAFPTCIIILGYVFPDLTFDLLMPPSILLCITAFIGLPLLYATSYAEQDDYEGTVKWFRILGISPLPVFAVALIEAAFSSSLTGNSFWMALVISICASFFATSIFNLIIRHYALTTLFEEYWKELEGKKVDSWINRIHDPGLNFDTFISVVGIGALQSLLNLVVIGIGSSLTIVLNAVISFALGFIVGWVLQYKSTKGYMASIWITSFHISSCFLFMLLMILIGAGFQRSLTQWLFAISQLIIFTAIWAIPIGTFLSWLSVRHFRRQKDLRAHEGKG